jgi:hypothetical protein
MQKYLLCIALLYVSVAHAADLNETEKGYVWMDVATTVAVSFCGAHEIKDGVLKMGDRNGIDVKAYGRAIIAAAAATNGWSYKRSDLIPGVTQVYRLATRTIMDDLEQNKAKTCGNWLSILREVGTIEW